MAYFFHLTEGDEVTFDRDGIDLPDVQAAQMVALRTIAELVAEAVASGERNYRGFIEVLDDDGGTMLTFTFACPVNIEGSALA
jgi:hypothetical protein